MASETSFPENQPYKISVPEKGKAIIQFAPICDHDRTDERMDELRDLISAHDLVICDLGLTEQIVSAWVRLIERMTSDAENMGKRVIVASMRDNLMKEIADLQGIGERIEYVPTVDEALSE